MKPDILWFILPKSFTTKFHVSNGCQLMHSRNNYLLEFIAPNKVELINFLILSNSILCQIPNKALSSFCIFLCLQSVIFDLHLPIFFWLISMCLFLDLWWKDCWCRKNFIKVLKLLTCLLFIRICHWITIYLSHIWKSVYNKSS